MNNPLKYTDPSGEIVWWAAAIIVGGSLNAAFNADNIDSFGDFLKYFGVGAAAGVADGYVGNLVAGAISLGGISGGLIAGGTAGATGGLILGGGNSWLSNGNFEDILSSAFIGAAMGGVTGAVIGGATGLIRAHKYGLDLWNGESKFKPQVNIDKEMMEEVAPKIPDATTSRTTANIEGNVPKLTPYEKGKIGVDQAIKEFQEEGGVVYSQQVTIKVNGVTIRPDFVGYKDGMLYIYEVKNGPYAGFTKNQKMVISEILKERPVFIPRGVNAGRVPMFQDLIINNRPYTGNYNFVIKHYY